jgi:predicted ATPase
MFRLEYLKVIGHPQLGDLVLFFTEAEDRLKAESPYKTVIIGPNGTGKSYILRTIIDLFRELDELRKSGKRKKHVIGSYLIKYSVEGNRFTYGNIKDIHEVEIFDFKRAIVPGGQQWRERGKEYFLTKNEKQINIDEIELPKALLASSFMLTDKFVFLTRPEEFELYKYLGVRATRSTAGTRSYTKNTINSLANSNIKKIFSKTLPAVLDFLELEKYLFVRYSVKRRNIFFTGKLNRNIFIDFINDYEAYIEKRNKNENRSIVPWYSFQNYKSLLEDEKTLDSVIDFLNQKYKSLKQNTTSKSTFFEYDLIENLKELEYEIPMINMLDKLNLIESPELYFKKRNNESYSFEGASSGEAHFLTSIIGILANISDNSVILMDEPEISLHPNWQMKYMEFIRQVFNQFESCHFIIATHSHFLLSDLKGDSSKIIGLTRNDKIESVDLPMNLDTFGWSAEEVLLEVFNVPTTRNYFIADRIGEILELVSKKDRNENLIREKVLSLLNKNVLNLSDNDPLRTVWSKLVSKYGQRP